MEPFIQMIACLRICKRFSKCLKLKLLREKKGGGIDRKSFSFKKL
jgi:hypothetical protein